MIDYFALALTHGLLVIACWRLLLRDDLDVEVEPPAPDEDPAPPPAAPTRGLRIRA